MSKNALAAPLNGFDQSAGGRHQYAVRCQRAGRHHRQRAARRPGSGGPLSDPADVGARLPRRPARATPRDDPALVQAADQFEKALRSPSAKARFSDGGRAHPTARRYPSSDWPNGVTADLVPPAPPPSAAQTLNVVRLWNAAVADSNTLAVIDLSGSMADPAGNGQSKVAIATAAASSGHRLLSGHVRAGPVGVLPPTRAEPCPGSSWCRSVRSGEQGR